MPRSVDWRSFINEQGDFELPSYLFRVINDLMKRALDLGTLLSTDPTRLRSYKEQTKNTFKDRWMDIARALESFDIIVPCGCPHEDYCRACGGSRYRLNSALSPDEMREMIMGSADPVVQAKLEAGLQKALREVG
jgi:hypothetical protein